MAERRVYIIGVDDDPADYAEVAAAEQCGEIVAGVPPALLDELGDVELPHMHLEETVDPEELPGPSLDDVASTIEASPDLTDEVKAALVALLDAVRVGMQSG